LTFKPTGNEVIEVACFLFSS